MVIYIRILSGLLILIFILTAWELHPSTSLSEWSSYASIVIGILGIHITWETLSLAKALKRQRTRSAIKQNLDNFMETLKQTEKCPDVTILSSFPTQEKAMKAAIEKALKAGIVKSIDVLGKTQQACQRPGEETIARILAIATTLEKTDSLSDDREILNCIEHIKRYEVSPPLSNRQIIDILNILLSRIS